MFEQELGHLTLTKEINTSVSKIFNHKMRFVLKKAPSYHPVLGTIYRTVDQNFPPVHQ